MKNIVKIFTLIACVLLLLPSCSKEDLFPGGGDNGATGQVNFRKMAVEVNSTENQVRATEVNIGGFLVEITSAKGTTEYAGTYAEMPEVLTLPVGDYTVTVKSPSNPDAAWESPYYEGSQAFSIKENEVTFVDPVVCRLGNVKVTIKYDAKMLPLMGDDCAVTVQTGVGGRLEFAKAETRSGNFRYVEGEGTATLVATFRGTVDENYEESVRTYTDVAPGNHYIITYSLKSPTGEEPDVTGTITPGVVIEASVEVIDMNVNVEVDDDVLEDNDRPQQGDKPGTDPDDPTPPTPDKNPPTIVATIDGSTSFTSPIEVHEGITATIKVTSEAQGGVTGFTIDINSTTLTDEILSDPVVGLGTHIDLVNPGAMADHLVNDLHFPINVGGMNDIPVFDISSFVPLLGVYGAGDHKFIVTVTDANGTTQQTLYFVTK